MRSAPGCRCFAGGSGNGRRCSPTPRRSPPPAPGSFRDRLRRPPAHADPSSTPACLQRYPSSNQHTAVSHQVLAAQLGLTVSPLPAPHQGTQRQIDLFGVPVRVGSYNTYAAVASPRRITDSPIQIAADPRTGEVHALRGPGFASIQFHPESLLSPDGVTVLSELTGALLARAHR